MGLESATYIEDLNVANPADGDGKSQGDDHLRLIKAAIKTTFPGLGGRFARVQGKTAGYNLAASDNSTIIHFTGAGPYTLGSAAVATLGNGFVAVIANLSSGLVTIDPNASETVNGATTLDIAAGSAGILYCTGTEFLFFRTLPFRLALNSLSLTALRTLTLQDASGIIALNDVEDQTITGGAAVTSKDLGTITTGTVTPECSDRPMQHYINGGAHTLAASASAGSMLLDITNNGSAGVITASGFTLVTGDGFTTTNGHKFRCHISKGNAGQLLSVQALQ